MSSFNNCPPTADLLLLAIATPEPRHSTLAAHVDQCARCAPIVADFHAIAAGVRRMERRMRAAVSAHLDDDVMAAVIEGSAASSERDAAVRHLVDCASCRAQVAELSAVLGDPLVVAERSAVQRAPSRGHRFVRPVVVAGLAAAAMLVIAVRQGVGPRDTMPTRDEYGTLSTGPVIIAPTATVNDSAVFRWSRVEGADRYRVTVFLADGSVVWETQTADTFAVPASPAQFSRDTTYLWKVEARMNFDRWLGSGLAEFRVRGGAR
jgi:Arc/MetJ family transcription regulator